MEELNNLLIIYESALLKECWKYYKNREDVWDLLQDASIKMAKSFHTFNPSKKFLPWARRVILTTHEDHKREKEKEFGECEVHNRQHLDQYATIDPEVEEKLSTLLSRLPEEDANLLSAVYVDGVSQTSMAKILGISQPAIFKRLEKAKKRFREAYDELFDYSDKPYLGGN